MAAGRMPPTAPARQRHDALQDADADPRDRRQGARDDHQTPGYRRQPELSQQCGTGGVIRSGQAGLSQAGELSADLSHIQEAIAVIDADAEKLLGAVAAQDVETILKLFHLRQPR